MLQFKVSYSTVVLYIGIIKVWGFLPKNPIKKSANYQLFDSMAALVKQGQSSTPADILVDIFNPYNSANGLN